MNKVFFCRLSIIIIMFMMTEIICSIALAQNLIVNGNFSSGNSGFITNYAYDIIIDQAAKYCINVNPVMCHNYAESYNDHTSGNGQMMIINGSTNSDTTVWQQMVSVTPNKDFLLTGWISSWYSNNPAKLRFFINNIQIGEDFVANMETAVWSQFSIIWNSGINKIAVIKIIDINTAASGNDFSLDDLSFVPTSSDIDNNDEDDLNDGLLAHYEFENNANDSSGNGNHGTENGGLRYSEGIIGNSAKFDGVDDFIEINDNSHLRLYDTDFTLSAWVNILQYNDSYHSAILVKRGDGNQDGYFFSIRGTESNWTNNSDFGKLYYQISGGGDPLILSEKKISLNEWYLISVVYIKNELSIKLFINGLFDNQKKDIQPPNKETFSNLFIGKDSADAFNGYQFKGCIDDIRVYNRALTESKINELYIKGIQKPGLFDYQKNDSFKDIDFFINKYYAISDNIFYVSTDMKTFIPYNNFDTNLNSVQASLFSLLCVGDNGQIYVLNINQNELTDISISQINNNLLDIATDGRYFIIVGEDGIIIRYDSILKVFSFEESKTNADITAVIYDNISKKYYAVTDDGELLDSSDGISWFIKKVDTTNLTNIEKNDDVIILSDKKGSLYVSLDENNFNLIQIQNNTDEFIDIKYVDDRYIAVTSNTLYTSYDATIWQKDSIDFLNESINSLFVHNNSLHVLTDQRIKSVNKFDNVESGTTNTTTLAGVDVYFEKSNIEFQNYEIIKFNIVPNDTMYILKDNVKIAKIILGSDSQFNQFSENTSILESILKKNRNI